MRDECVVQQGLHHGGVGCRVEGRRRCREITKDSANQTGRPQRAGQEGSEKGFKQQVPQSTKSKLKPQKFVVPGRVTQRGARCSIRLGGKKGVNALRPADGMIDGGVA